LPKLQLTAPEKLGDVIELICIKQQVRKGECLRLMLELAAKWPKFPIKDYGNEKSYNCTYGMDDAEYRDESFVDYRLQNKIRYQNAFFDSALRRGASIYESLDSSHDLKRKTAKEVLILADQLPMS